MKNADKKEKSKATKKDATKGKKQPAKAVTANTKKADTKSKGKTDAPAKVETTVFGVIKDTAEIMTFSPETAKSDLQAKHSETVIEKMLSGETKILPSEDTLYSTDKARLESLIVERGWNSVDGTVNGNGTVSTPAITIHENGTIESDTEPQQEEDTTPDLTYEIEDEGNHYQSPEERVIDADVTDVDLTDPNQDTFDAYFDTPEFVAVLNQKENKLLGSLANAKKQVASLSDSEKAIWQKIQEKRAAYVKDEAQSDDQEPLDNFRKPSGETALAKTDDAIQGLVEPADDTPLSEDEKGELLMREKAIEHSKDAFDKAPLVMAENLAEIRQKKLYRETGLTFEQYVADRFAITREYAQRLAQGGDFMLVLNEVTGGETKQLAGSVNAVDSWTRNTNEIADILGVKKSDFETMKPIIDSIQDVVTELITDEQGNVSSAKPRILQAAQEVIIEVINTGTVTIGGDQMTVQDASQSGILKEAVQSQIVESVAENIKAHKQQIFDYVKDNNKRRTEPHEAAAPKPASKNEFKGAIPTYSVECSAHPEYDDNFIVNVFNAGFEFKCGCKFQKLTTSGDLFVCIETGGKFVKHD